MENQNQQCHHKRNLYSASYDNIRGANQKKPLKVECDNQCPHYAVATSSTPQTKYKPIGEREIPFSTDYETLPCRRKKADLAKVNAEYFEQAHHIYDCGGAGGSGGAIAGGGIASSSIYEEVEKLSREPRRLSPHPATTSSSGYSDIYDRPTKQPNNTSKASADRPRKLVRNSSISNSSAVEGSKTEIKQQQQQQQQQQQPVESTATQNEPAVQNDGSVISPGLSGAFDSDTLKRMLQGLPANGTPVSQGLPANGTPASQTQEHHHIEGVPDYSSFQNQGGGTGKIAEQHPQNVSSNNKAESKTSATLRENNTSVLPKTVSNTKSSEPTHKNLPPAKPERMHLESMDLNYRANKSRYSYPDSGISEMSYKTARSAESSGTRRSDQSGRHSLPPRLGLNSLRGKSGDKCTTSKSNSNLSDKQSEGSSGASSSKKSSSLVRQFTNSDCSESCSGGSEDESDSSINTTCTETQSMLANRSAAVRKAGWLTVKNWLIHKKRKIELASRRTWKRYWVCLKGAALLFYNCDDHERISSEDIAPKHTLIIEHGIAQGIPEHPKRENVFALSTALGDAFLFEATSQTELENWISGIHSACASSFARQHGKENTLKLLRNEIQKLENSIDLDIKMKKMAALQLNVVVDTKSKSAIEKQILQWNENLEKLYIEQYRLRCYMASLQGTEIPNPKNVLSCVSKQTKAVLSRVGVFTVNAFHALVCSRAPYNTTLSQYTTSTGSKKKSIMSTFKADTVAARIRPRSPMAYNQQAWPNNSAHTDVTDHVVVDLQTNENDNPHIPIEAYSFCDNLLRVTLPNEQYVVLGISEKITVAEVLEMVCSKRQMNPIDHFIRIKLPGSENYKIPEKSILLSGEEFDAIEVCGKILFPLELSRERSQEFGLSIEAELAEDTEEDDELCVFVSDVVKGSIAHRKGLQVGDELVVINSKVVKELDMVYVENLLLDELHITLTLRSCRVERPVSTSKIQEHADVYIENMMCPPPPTQNRISDQVIGDLIVPAPTWVNLDNNAGNGHNGGSNSTETTPRVAKNPNPMSVSPGTAGRDVDSLLVEADRVTQFCRLLHEPYIEDQQLEDSVLRLAKPMNDCQRIHKIIIELVQTERQYVKDLNCLISRYLEPLKEETFLSNDEIVALFGNIQEIVQFQKMFLQSLEEAIELEPEFHNFTDSKRFTKILFSIAGSFLYYANHFKLYSSFCASHSRAQKVLTSEENYQLHNFLRARNPKQQHSATMESFLIKPIQRILKYPLLLKQLKMLTSPDSGQHQHLTEALKGMETVAEHINEMQKIYEEYGAIFDNLGKVFKESHNKAIDINVGELQMYGNVNWLNALDELGKIKKGSDLVTMVFVFKAGVVILAQERAKGKRRSRIASHNRVITNGGQDLSEVIRFQCAVAVDELQIRSVMTNSTSERHGIWELVHMRSEKEGRPEKVFQFASSIGARKDFLRTIHCTIRENYQKMVAAGYGPGMTKSELRPKSSIISTQPSDQNKQPGTFFAQKNQQPQQPNNHPPHYQHLQHMNFNSSNNMNNQKPLDLDIESYFINNEVQLESDMRSAAEGGGRNNNIYMQHQSLLPDFQNVRLRDPSGSQSTLTSQTGGAKLLHSSKTKQGGGGRQAGVYASNNDRQDTVNSRVLSNLGSPIWKPRGLTADSPSMNARSRPNSTCELHPPQDIYQHHHPQEDPYASISEIRQRKAANLTTEQLYAGSAYGNYASIVYDDKNSAVLLTPPNATLHQDYTEC